MAHSPEAQTGSGHSIRQNCGGEPLHMAVGAAAPPAGGPQPGTSGGQSWTAPAPWSRFISSTRAGPEEPAYKAYAQRPSV